MSKFCFYSLLTERNTVERCLLNSLQAVSGQFYYLRPTAKTDNHMLNFGMLTLAKITSFCFHNPMSILVNFLKQGTNVILITQVTIYSYTLTIKTITLKTLLCVKD